MEVRLCSDADDELKRLRRRSVQEHVAMLSALAKLEEFGPTLGFPHTSHVEGASVRELRPRAGRSPWRAFYRQIGDALYIGSIGPEAHQNERGFNRAVRLAEQRLTALSD